MRWKFACAAIAVTVLVPVGTVQADSGTIGGGTAVTTTLTSPVDGASFVAGTTIPVSGTVELGQGAADKDTDLVFVLDSSGSTSTTTNLACGTPTNTVLDCEKAATRGVIADANDARSPIARVGVVGFPSPQIVPLVAPGQFSNNLSGFTSGGSTQFDVGITRARDLLAPPSAASGDLMVLLTDGDGTFAPVDGIANMVIKAFTIAGAGCSAALLQAIAAGAPGSGCSVVTSLATLPQVVADTIDSTLDGVDITVNGVVAAHVPVSANGQSTTSFSTTLTGVAPGNDIPICAIARATDAIGSGSVSDCSTVDVLPAGTVVVDCSGSTVCNATATDPGRSTLSFSAPPEFDETVTIAPDAGGPGSCGGSPCTTGYQLGFPTNSPNGPVAAITVVTANKVSVADRLKAAVYLDDTRITAECNNRLLVARLRDRFGVPEPIPCITITYQSDGRVQYFVKFNADPAIRFR